MLVASFFLILLKKALDRFPNWFPLYFSFGLIVAQRQRKRFSSGFLFGSVPVRHPASEASSVPTIPKTVNTYPLPPFPPLPPSLYPSSKMQRTPALVTAQDVFLDDIRICVRYGFTCKVQSSNSSSAAFYLLGPPVEFWIHSSFAFMVQWHLLRSDEQDIPTTRLELILLS